MFFGKVGGERLHRLGEIRQRSAEWFRKRKGVMTGTRITYLYRLQRHKGDTRARMKAKLLERLERTRPIPRRLPIAVEYGIRMEISAEQQLRAYLSDRCLDPSDELVGFELRHPGLIKDLGCLGFSPDACVVERLRNGGERVSLAEYKAPYSRTRMKLRGYRGLHVFGDFAPAQPNVYKLHKRIGLPLKIDHYNQVQWGMHILGRALQTPSSVATWWPSRHGIPRSSLSLTSLATPSVCAS